MKNTFRELRKVRRMKRMAQVTSINLVSMIDIFVILIIYLLVNTAAVQVVGAEQVNLPKSLSQEPPRETVSVIITPEDILVDGKPLMTRADAEKFKGVIEPLKQRLLVESPAPTRHADAKASAAAGEVNILADKDIPYSLLKQVMVTCTSASFAKISLGVVPTGGADPK